MGRLCFQGGFFDSLSCVKSGEECSPESRPQANAELLNNLGNFVNRIIKFAIAKYDSAIPDPKNGEFDYATEAYEWAAEDRAFVDDVNKLLASYIDQLDHQKIRAALSTLMHISARGNQYIQDNRLDNALLESNPSRAAEVVLVALNLIYLVAALVHPFMPSTSDSILSQLDAVPRSIPDKFELDLWPGHRLGQAQHLFSRIDPKMVPVWRAQFGGAASSSKEAGAPEGAAAPLSKRQLVKLKKAALQAAAEAEAARPRTDEERVLEEQIKAQGDKIRRLKSGAAEPEPATEGGEVKTVEDEVAILKALKEELAALSKSLADVQL